MCPIVRGVWNILHKCSVVENHIWFLQASTGLDWRVREEARGRAVVAAEGGTTRSAITVRPTKCYEHQEDQILRTSFQDGFSKKNLKTCFPLPSCYQVFKSGYCTNVYVYCNALIIFRFFPFFAWKCYFHFFNSISFSHNCGRTSFHKMWWQIVCENLNHNHFKKFKIYCLLGLLMIEWEKCLLLFTICTYYFSTEYFPPKCFHQKLATKKLSKTCLKVQEKIFAQFTWSSLNRSKVLVFYCFLQ